MLTKQQVKMSQLNPLFETVTVTSLILVPEQDVDFLSWQDAVSSYVIQSTKVENDYEFLNKLGKGSFGYVLLANPK